MVGLKMVTKKKISAKMVNPRDIAGNAEEEEEEEGEEEEDEEFLTSVVKSIFLYACETWTITADTERRIQVLEMRCFRKLLGISYTDHITNEKVKTSIGNDIRLYEDLLTSVKRR